jgi:superoxide dismutase, Cu-Zn family
MDRIGITVAALLLAGSCFAGAAQAQSANAELINGEGKAIGNATLSQMEQGVHISVEAEGLPPGTHAFHIHETGECEPPDFKSAGDHYNPGGHQHGWNNPEGYHAGDLPNVHVQDDGVLAIEYFTDAVTLGEGEATLFDDDGSAIVIHVGEDDYETDPTGGAGDRLACGVIQGAT